VEAAGLACLADPDPSRQGRKANILPARYVPAENNLAERELRPLVVARKVSFGSQSQDGAHTREVLMTVLHTLRKQTDNSAQAFRAALDQVAASPAADPFQLLFPRPP